jgi:chromosome segregation ATPase
MLSFSQWKAQMQRLSEHLARTTHRVKDVQQRARTLKDKAEVETKLKTLRNGIQKKNI